ncbi:hypothetical protein BD408DRAFT_428236 [Parasitella parasitica]|nr:hypothetical protein BD408DRAFT_428236 [Parasitella parasitica]
MLRQAATATTTRISSTSATSAPAPLWSPLPAGSPNSIPINSLLYADDVAIIGSAREVKHMLELAESHSLSLGYRWAPAKCALINPPSPTSSTYVDLCLYGESLPVVDEFVYLGVPFDRKGICSSSIVKKCQRGALASMSQLNAIGCNRSADFRALEKVQDTCLRMIFGGHRAASTMVFRHLTNLPLMKQRAAILVSQYCLRSQFLPEDGLISLLSASLPNSSLQQLKKQKMAACALEEVPVANQRELKKWFFEQRQDWHSTFLDKTDKVLIRACRPAIGIDPVMHVPASRPCRSRLVRYRMGWLPVSHPATSFALVTLPPLPDSFHGTIIDHALNLLPTSPSSSNCPPWWTDLCTLLWHFDQLCNPDGDYTTDPPPGQLWASPAVQAS